MNRYQSSFAVPKTDEVLRSCLEDILFSIKPSEGDAWQRQNIINQLTSIVHSVQSLSSVSVKPFGSFASDLYTKWGDLDISVELSIHPNTSTNISRKRNLLRNIQRALQRRGFGQNFQYIPMAKVPVLMFNSGYPTISCDISIDNYEGCIKSKFFLWLSRMDERFRDLVLVIKEWAKANGINNSKSGTLNSFCLCLLVIFHLQTCRPAIFPPLREIYDGKLVSDSDAKSIFMVPERIIEEKCIGAARKFKTSNRDTLSQLLVSFFEKFSGIGNWASQYVINTYSGRMELGYLKPEWSAKSYALKVEDPFEQRDISANNAARTVSTQGFISITHAFANAHQMLSSSATLTDRSRLLQFLVRPDIIRHLNTSRQQLLHDYTGRLPIRSQGRQSYNAGTPYSTSRASHFRAGNQPAQPTASSSSRRY